MGRSQAHLSHSVMGGAGTGPALPLPRLLPLLISFSSQVSLFITIHQPGISGKPQLPGLLSFSLCVVFAFHMAPVSFHSSLPLTKLHVPLGLAISASVLLSFPSRGKESF